MSKATVRVLYVSDGEFSESNRAPILDPVKDMKVRAGSDVVISLGATVTEGHNIQDLSLSGMDHALFMTSNQPGRVEATARIFVETGRAMCGVTVKRRVVAGASRLQSLRRGDLAD